MRALEVVDVRVTDVVDDATQRARESAEARREDDTRRGFFGTHVSHWCALDDGGEVRARVRVGADDDADAAAIGAMDGVTFDVRFVCDVANARVGRGLVGKDGNAAPTRGERVDEGVDGEHGGVMYDVICAFDGVDVSDVPRHTTMNLGAFEVIVRDGEGAERARGAALARVEQDDAGVLRRFVLPYKAVFE